jgi:hypothetical protein
LPTLQEGVAVKVTTQVTTEIDLTPELLGQWFASMDDESQTQFFVAAAKTASQWPKAFGGWSYQFYAVGSHLRNCECSTDEARELVESLANGLATGTHA